MAERTTLVIAQRLAIVRSCDRILATGADHIVEEAREGLAADARLAKHFETDRS